jgi:hypothetical protein
MNILNYTDAETYLANKQVYFRKEIANSDLQTIAQANMVHKVGKVEINDTSNRYHNCKAITIEINGIETTIYEYKTDLELFAWLRTNLIPVNTLVDNYLKREQLPSKEEMEMKLDYLIANKQESFKTKYDKLTFKFGFRTCFYWLNKKLNK